MNPESLKDLPHVSKWLAYSHAAVEIVKEIGQGLDDEARMRMLIEQNVLLQITHLKTHPYVAARHAAGKLQIHGWVYDIRLGDIVAYDEKQEKFLPVEERYAEDIANLAKSNISQTC